MLTLLAAADPATLNALLTIAAIVLFVYGVLCIIRGAVLMGIVLIILAFAVGPGGWSIFG